MDTTIIIPCVRRSRFLEKTTLPAIAAHTPSSVPVVIAHEPDLNVSECRQKWMDLAETRYVYFMDVDSIIHQDEWLEILLDIMDEYQAGAVTSVEHWGGSRTADGKPFQCRNYVTEEKRVAGAGCLYDRNVGAKWDPFLGETYGYIGRELEDVDFGYCIWNLGSKAYATDRVTFDHNWHEQDVWASDEYVMWPIIGMLLRLKWRLPPGKKRDEFFRLLHPQATMKFEKNHYFRDHGRKEGIRAVFGDLMEYWGGAADIFLPPIGGECFPPGHNGPLLTTPEERCVEDIWSSRYKEVKPRSPRE